MSLKADGDIPAFAFPLMPTQELWERGMPIQVGMTLREYYAGQALIGLLAMCAGGFDIGDAEETAARCYHYADAMMIARNKEH